METLHKFCFYFFVSFEAFFLCNHFFVHLFSSTLLCVHFKGLLGTLPQVHWQQNIGSLYVSSSCHSLVGFFFDFFNGHWLLGISSSIPSSAFGEKC